MTNKKLEPLEYLEKYDIGNKEKEELIANLYKLANINFDDFINNNLK